MSHSGVEGAPTVVLLVPTHRMAFSVFTAFVGRLIDGEHHIDFGRNIFEVVKFIYFLKLVGHTLCKEMVLLLYHHGTFLHIRIRGVIEEVGSRQTTIPVPVVLRICSRVDAYVTTARLDVALEGLFLLAVEHITRRIKEHHRLEISEL